MIKREIKMSVYRPLTRSLIFHDILFVSMRKNFARHRIKYLIVLFKLQGQMSSNLLRNRRFLIYLVGLLLLFIVCWVV